MPHLVEVYEKCTRMQVYERSPYAGALVFAAFSGSHQDAIAKGMKYREENAVENWNVPYIPIDPRDISRTYDADVIRVNSQSGKGGIGYILEHIYGYSLPSKMREDLSYLCKGISDKEHRELKVEEILNIFKTNYFVHNSRLDISDMHFFRKDGGVETEIAFVLDGKASNVKAIGNGSLDAVSNAIKEFTGIDYTLKKYSEHSMQEEGDGSKSMAVAYIGIMDKEGKMHWGAGTNTDIIHAGADALLAAVNKMLA
jgi:2-isopropylmalate synthase